VPAEDLNKTALSFLGVRSLYIAYYMAVTHNTLAMARSGIYAWSIGIPLVALWQAGNRMAENV
jgi:hypothetical protein